MSAVALAPHDDLHPSHLLTLAPTVSAAVLRSIASHPRFAARFASLLPPEFRDGAAPPATNDAARLALRSVRLVADAGLLMGAAWHARSIGRCIGAEVVAALEAGIGREARLWALRSATFALAPAETSAAAPLVAHVRSDGLRCLVRWRDGLAEPFRTLATLRLPHGNLPEAAGENATSLIAAVLERFRDDV